VAVDDGGSEVDEFAVGDAGLLAQSGARNTHDAVCPWSEPNQPGPEEG
jgi:hypothetical protein